MAGLFPQRSESRELVLSPQERLVAGGPAEQLEQLIQSSFKQGVHRLFVDLRGVRAARDFAQRGALEIIVAGDKLAAGALVESVHRAYLPVRVLAFAEDVPIGEGRHPVDGRPTAYVCRNRTCDARVTSVGALVARCAA